MSIIGTKNDTGKRQWWFIKLFVSQFLEVIDILDMGNKKYPCVTGDNWKYVENAEERYQNAIMRHLVDGYFAGESTDSESGKHHLSHVITNCLFLIWLDKQKKEKGIENEGNKSKEPIDRTIFKIGSNPNDIRTNYDEYLEHFKLEWEKHKYATGGIYQTSTTSGGTAKSDPVPAPRIPEATRSAVARRSGRRW